MVIAGIVTLIIASTHSDDLVADDYYKNGLAINRQLESKQRAALKGISAVMSFSGTAVSVGLSGSVTDEKLELELSHPLEADSDFSVTLKRVEEGLYTGSLPAPIGARWHWILRGSEGDGWRLDGDVQIDDMGYEPGG